MNRIARKLFETQSIKVADPTSPFWYTSGKIGPYFINTQFLYGSERDSSDLLSTIDAMVNSPMKLITEISSEVERFYNSNEIYQSIMDEYVTFLRQSELFNECSIITGGERRDWFFSIVAAKLTGKRHVYIFKDLSLYDEDGVVKNLGNEKVAHIADLITEASSYERAWIPAISQANGNLIYTSSIVDRCQGGYEKIIKAGIECCSPVKIDRAFFDQALQNENITKDQYAMIIDFTNDPDLYGKTFLETNKEYLKKSMESSDNSIKNKSNRCYNENPYLLSL